MAENNRNDVSIGPRDILFECPACHRSLVIDEAAQGMIVDCPQCKTNVIVPPKPAAGAPAPKPPPAAPPPPAETPKPAAAAEPPAAKPGLEPNVAELLNRLVTLGYQLKELQTQRTEIATNVAARLNEINRQMVMLARQETSHHQVLQEWNQILAKIKATVPKPGSTEPSPAGKSQVNFKA